MARRIGATECIFNKFYMNAWRNVSLNIIQCQEQINKYSANRCTGLVFPRHLGSPARDQAACLEVSFCSIGTTGGSFFLPRASRSAGPVENDNELALKAGNPGFANEWGIPHYRDRQHPQCWRANIRCAGLLPLTGSRIPFRIPERVCIHAGPGG